MALFKKRTAPEAAPSWPPEEYEPVLRCSICTGEQVACMRERSTGRLHEVMLIRSPSDLEAFCSSCGADAKTLRKVY
ncbi:MAG: aspartate dehydrogenase [Oscillospiraceae bacterium]|nr:aspartate dehydrogenase [Oscillospiraceae bacterium]